MGLDPGGEMKKAFRFSFVLWLIAAPLAAQSITVTSPAAGVPWDIGGTYTIAWTKTGTMQATVAIRLRSAGSSESDPAALTIANGEANDGSYTWTIPASVAPGSYFIRVRTDDSTVIGDSGTFTIKRNVNFSRPERPDVQPGQGSTPPDVHPSQNTAGGEFQIAQYPDLFVHQVRYLAETNRVFIRITNQGDVAYDGFVQIAMQVEGGGCQSQSQRVHIPSLYPNSSFLFQEFRCTAFPSSCSHRFRVVLTPERACMPNPQRVFDGMVLKYNLSENRVAVPPPIRLRFSHGSKSLACGDTGVSQANTITRYETLNDLGDVPGTLDIFLEVALQNCGPGTGSNSMRLRITRRQGNTNETICNMPFAGGTNLETGESRLITVPVTLPIRRGQFSICISDYYGEDECQCPVYFQFAGEFFSD
jgi:hypothetical protein